MTKRKLNELVRKKSQNAVITITITIFRDEKLGKCDQKHGKFDCQIYNCPFHLELWLMKCRYNTSMLHFHYFR